MESSSLQLDLDLGRKVGDEMIEGINQSSTSSSSLPMNSLQIQSRFEPGSLNANLAVISDTLEQEILVVFELPDGSIAEEKFQLGQTVELLKSHIEAEYGISMMEQKLYYEDRLMLDPLSLLDYFPENEKENGKEDDDMQIENRSREKTRAIPKEMYVVVEGDLATESRK